MSTLQKSKNGKLNPKQMKTSQLREIVSRREELQTSERSESLIECFSTANNERFDQTFQKFVGGKK